MGGSDGYLYNVSTYEGQFDEDFNGDGFYGRTTSIDRVGTTIVNLVEGRKGWSYQIKEANDPRGIKLAVGVSIYDIPYSSPNALTSQWKPLAVERISNNFALAELTEAGSKNYSEKLKYYYGLGKNADATYSLKLFSNATLATFAVKELERSIAQVDLSAYEEVFNQDVNNDGKISKTSRSIELFGKTNLSIGTDGYIIDNQGTRLYLKSAAGTIIKPQNFDGFPIGIEKNAAGFQLVRLRNATRFELLNIDNTGRIQSSRFLETSEFTQYASLLQQRLDLNQSVTTTKDTAIVIRLFSNDSSVNRDALVLKSLDRPNNGTLTDNQDGTVTYKPNSNFNGSDSFSYTISDGIITSSNTIVPINITLDKESQLIEPIPNILLIEGGTEKSLLKFTKIAHEGVGRNEAFAFVIDDLQGRIGGISPGQAGYLAAALDRSQVIFSNLGNNSINLGFDRDSQRYLNFTPGDRIEFGLITDDTLDAVKADLSNGKSTDKVLFSLPGANAGNSTQAKFTALPNNGGYEIAWEDNLNEGKGNSNADFNDFVMKIETLDNFKPTVGTGLQGKPEGEVIDLRDILTGQPIKVDTFTVSDAAYNNYIGFYAVEDTLGTLANGLKVGDIGYAEAAIKSAILNSSKNETQIDRLLTGGKIFAPVVIANGTFEDYLKTNPQNQANSNIHAYFNYLGANTDKVDHFRLLGDNKFGVEDMFGGGDRDYNDIVFQMTVKS